MWFSYLFHIWVYSVFPGEEYTQYSLHNVHRQYPWVRALTKHPQLIQVVKAVLGPDVILLDSRFICKYPALKPDIQQTEEEGLPYVAWHQDMRWIHILGKKTLRAFVLLCFVLSHCHCFVYRYWGIAGGPVLSVWLALDDSLQENGALQVIPGTSATHSCF